MDYEKAYKEALERAQVLYNDKNEIGYANAESVLEEVFPLLKESEDEKIRKELIEHCRNTRCVTEEGAERMTKYIAWLEKQGMSYTKRDVDDAFVEGMAFAKYELEKQSKSSIKWNKNTEGNKPQVNHSVLMKTTQSIAEGEWKGEYWEQYRWAGIVRDSDVLSWIELSDLDKQGEQKPWSEKDKKMIGRIRSIVEKYAFSESAVDVNGELCEKEYIDADNWLKSLKDKYTWKPSIAQLNALSIVSKGNAPDDIEAIVSLYNDLKKLRKESKR